MQTPGWIIIGAAFCLFVCVLVGLAIAAAGGSAVQDALAADQTVSATQRSTNVCVGLFQVGACTSQQTSTTTTTKAADSTESPMAVIMVISTITLVAVGAVLTLFTSEQ